MALSPKVGLWNDRVEDRGIIVYDDLFEFDKIDPHSRYKVPEDPSRLRLLEHGATDCDFEAVVAAMKSDQAVVIGRVNSRHADTIVSNIAERFGLQDQLELQATFASILGHRENVGKYFMSVNPRGDYRFVLSHSEGHRGSDIQLAAFYCYENSTDGGITILQNVDDESVQWDSLREVVTKIDLCGTILTPAESALAKATQGVDLESALVEDDEVLRERESPFPGTRLLEVLAKPRKVYSRILGRHVNVYWDNMASTDFDSGHEYLRLLRCCGLLQEPDSGLDISQLDLAYPRQRWNSGVKYEALFKSKITRKLAPGELLIHNNLTWTHSCSNWTPGSGKRKMAAAFA